MLEIIALMKPVQLNDSSVSDAIDTPAFSLQLNDIQTCGTLTIQVQYANIVTEFIVCLSTQLELEPLREYILQLN